MNTTYFLIDIALAALIAFAAYRYGKYAQLKGMVMASKPILTQAARDVKKFASVAKKQVDKRPSNGDDVAAHMVKFERMKSVAHGLGIAFAWMASNGKINYAAYEADDIVDWLDDQAQPDASVPKMADSGPTDRDYETVNSIHAALHVSQVKNLMSDDDDDDDEGDDGDDPYANSGLPEPIRQFMRKMDKKLKASGIEVTGTQVIKLDPKTGKARKVGESGTAKKRPKLDTTQSVGPVPRIVDVMPKPKKRATRKKPPEVV